MVKMMIELFVKKTKKQPVFDVLQMTSSSEATLRLPLMFTFWPIEVTISATFYEKKKHNNDPPKTWVVVQWNMTPMSFICRSLLKYQIWTQMRLSCEVMVSYSSCSIPYDAWLYWSHMGALLHDYTLVFLCFWPRLVRAISHRRSKWLTHTLHVECIAALLALRPFGACCNTGAVEEDHGCSAGCGENAGEVFCAIDNLLLVKIMLVLFA